MVVDDPLRKKERVVDPVPGLSDTLGDQTREFIKIWNHARYVRGQQDMLSRYLVLPANKRDPAHAEFENDLRARRVVAGIELFPDDCVRYLMNNAGALKRQAADWGIKIKKATVREMLPPPEISEAALKLAVQNDLNLAAKARNEVRLEMAQSIAAADKTGTVTIRDAYNLVDRMFPEYGVKTNINEFDIRDLDKFLVGFAKPVADAIKGALQAVLKAIESAGDPK